jgi:hypothetical protein
MLDVKTRQASLSNVLFVVLKDRAAMRYASSADHRKTPSKVNLYPRPNHYILANATGRSGLSPQGEINSAPDF